MPERRADEALPCRLSRQNFSKHLGRRQQTPRLADLGRLCAGAHSSRPGLVCPGRLCGDAGTRGLCPGLHNDRFVLGFVCLGAISSAQRGGETAHADRSARQYPVFYSHNSRENARCDGPRPSADRAGRLLHVDKGYIDFGHLHGSELFPLPEEIAREADTQPSGANPDAGTSATI